MGKNPPDAARRLQKASIASCDKHPVNPSGAKIMPFKFLP
jgi:hypothetical protein